MYFHQEGLRRQRLKQTSCNSRIKMTRIVKKWRHPNWYVRTRLSVGHLLRKFNCWTFLHSTKSTCLHRFYTKLVHKFYPSPSFQLARVPNEYNFEFHYCFLVHFMQKVVACTWRHPTRHISFSSFRPLYDIDHSKMIQMLFLLLGLSSTQLMEPSISFLIQIDDEQTNVN